jgi:hypothetical protein
MFLRSRKIGVRRGPIVSNVIVAKSVKTGGEVRNRTGGIEFLHTVPGVFAAVGAGTIKMPLTRLIQPLQGVLEIPVVPVVLGVPPMRRRQSKRLIIFVHCSESLPAHFIIANIDQINVARVVVKLDIKRLPVTS